jgi:hypothetical protein
MLSENYGVVFSFAMIFSILWRKNEIVCKMIQEKFELKTFRNLKFIGGCKSPYFVVTSLQKNLIKLAQTMH